MPKLPIVEKRYVIAFALTSTLFFSWGLASQFNDLLLHHFQQALDISRTRASLTQFAFYIGYFCAPLPAAMIIRRLGYKKTMVIGLAMYAIGAFLFVPAAGMRVYGIFLIALYIIAFGAAFLETSANPYIAILGDPSTSSVRLNFAQAFNGVATVLGPLVGGYVIFSGVEYTPAAVGADVAAGDRCLARQRGGRRGAALSGAGHSDGADRHRHRADPLSQLAGGGDAGRQGLAFRRAEEAARALCRGGAILLLRRAGRHLEPAGGFRQGSGERARRAPARRSFCSPPWWPSARDVSSAPGCSALSIPRACW